MTRGRRQRELLTAYLRATTRLRKQLGRWPRRWERERLPEWRAYARIKAWDERISALKIAPVCGMGRAQKLAGRLHRALEWRNLLEGLSA